VRKRGLRRLPIEKFWIVSQQSMRKAEHISCSNSSAMVIVAPDI
jgi:hypothetical protein